jgi:hypothetical protein
MAYDKGKPRSHLRPMTIRHTALYCKASPEYPPARAAEDFVGDAILPHSLQSTKKGYRLEAKSLPSPCLYDTPYLVSAELTGHPDQRCFWLRLPPLFRDEHHSQNPF